MACKAVSSVSAPTGSRPRRSARSIGSAGSSASASNTPSVTPRLTARPAIGPRNASAMGSGPAVVATAATVQSCVRSAGCGRTQTEKEHYRNMAYVIAEPCIGQKDNSCVEVCPVDCIHPTPDEPDYENVEQLYIDPDECIDCDACVEACPVDACFAEDQLPDEWTKYIQINSEYYAKA